MLTPSSAGADQPASRTDRATWGRDGRPGTAHGAPEPDPEAFGAIGTALAAADPAVADLVDAERQRRRHSLQLIAAENVCSPAVLEALASPLAWKTAEGQPGHRFHSGCELADEVERLAEARATEVFGARQAWTQPLSGSLANLICFRAVLRYLGRPAGGLTVLTMDLDQGGHLSHGSPPNVSRSLLGEVVGYGVDPDTGRLDPDQVAKRAEEVRPDLLICGTSAYPRELDVAAFRRIADDCGALLLVDMAHIAGLVAAGVHPSPIPHADLVTCSTYKAGGPRGGLVLAGDHADAQLLTEVSRAVFPGVQGTPDLGSVTAKAVFLGEAATEPYREDQRRIVANARRLGEELADRGHPLATGGTDNHLLLVDVVTGLDTTGAAAEDALARGGIYVNRNLLPYDPLPATVGSGIRLGTNTVTRTGMGPDHMAEVARLVDAVLCHGPTADRRAEVAELVGAFPVGPAASPALARSEPALARSEPAVARSEPRRTVFTNGVFDLFHDGHARLLERAAAQGDRLVVGVASDASCAASKRPPLQSWQVRAERVLAEPGVDAVLETPWSVDLTRGFYAEHGIDLHVQGDAGSSYPVAEELGILRILGRTEGISTSKLVAILETDESELLEGGALNDVRRVVFEGEPYVVKHGGRTVARRYPVELPDHRTRDEHRALLAFRSRVPDPSVLVEPVWHDGDALLILRSAPPEATTLEARLAAGDWDEALLTQVVDAAGELHDATRDDEDLETTFRDTAGFTSIKLDLQARGATDDPALAPQVRTFVDRSHQQHARVLLHGDLAPKNVLCFDEGFWLIDLEEAGWGDPALDVGYLCAHLLLAGLRDDVDASAVPIVRRLARRYLTGRLDTDVDLPARIGTWAGVFLLSRLDSAAPATDLDEASRRRVRRRAERLLRDPAVFWRDVS